MEFNYKIEVYMPFKKTTSIGWL